MTPLSATARALIRALSIDPEVLTEGLIWRHHGLGMLQAELTEELRIHVWHPTLVDSKMATPRCIHDHRFDIWSAVVLGTVIDIPCTVSLDGHRYAEPSWDSVNIYVIEHAKAQNRLITQEGCSTATQARLLGRGAVHENSPEPQEAGREYFIPKRTFHTTQVEGLAITVVHRSNFDEDLARVLCGVGSDVTAVSGIVRDEGEGERQKVEEVLREAGAAIRRLRR